MWPFRCKHKKCSRLEKLIAGLVIGGAIGSIVGKALMDRMHDGKKEDDDKEETDIEESDEE